MRDACTQSRGTTGRLGAYHRRYHLTQIPHELLSIAPLPIPPTNHDFVRVGAIRNTFSKEEPNKTLIFLYIKTNADLERDASGSATRIRHDAERKANSCVRGISFS
jgi:hypothetical protein